MAAVIKELLEHHVKEEETEMFKKARKSFSSEMMKEMGINFEDLKESFLQEVKKGKKIVQRHSHSVEYDSNTL